VKQYADKEAMPTEMLIAVDENDIPQGVGEKMQVHLDGVKHRAFSVMVYNRYGQLLLQKRSNIKYHSANLWSNSCCGHPISSEPVIEAAKRRLYEELGFTCDLIKITEVSYNLPIENGMYENEYTHVFAGEYNGDIIPNPLEVSEVEWVEVDSLKQKLEDSLQSYSKWFQLYMREHYQEVLFGAYVKATKNT
jgi:isopentenyl-diphosphate delta-isomerase